MLRDPHDSAHGLRGPADAAVQGGGERSSSRASDDERGRCAPWDPQTTVHVESIHINAARVVISLWNLAASLHEHIVVETLNAKSKEAGAVSTRAL
ncbi:hypothetical protein ABZP36_001813 [Zizania latifolia]